MVKGGPPCCARATCTHSFSFSPSSLEELSRQRPRVRVPSSPPFFSAKSAVPSGARHIRFIGAVEPPARRFLRGCSRDEFENRAYVGRTALQGYAVEPPPGGVRHHSGVEEG